MSVSGSMEKVTLESSFLNSKRNSDLHSGALQTLKIPCSLIRKWTSTRPATIVPLLNKCLDAVQLDAQCEDLEARLQAKIRVFNFKLKGMTGRAKKTYLNSGCVLFDVHINEILSCAELSTQVEVLEANIEQLQETVSDNVQNIGQLEKQVAESLAHICSSSEPWPML